MSKESLSLPAYEAFPRAIQPDESPSGRVLDASVGTFELEDDGPTGEELLFLPETATPPTMTPEGAELEADMPAALHPLAIAFKPFPMHYVGMWAV